MSELSATNCGCGCGQSNNGCMNNCMWLILILLLCGNNNNRSCGNDGFDCNCLLWLLLLSNCSGSGGFFGNDCGC